MNLHGLLPSLAFVILMAASGLDRWELAAADLESNDDEVVHTSWEAAAADFGEPSDTSVCLQPLALVMPPKATPKVGRPKKKPSLISLASKLSSEDVDPTGTTAVVLAAEPSNHEAVLQFPVSSGAVTAVNRLNRTQQLLLSASTKAEREKSTGGDGDCPFENSPVAHFVWDALQSHRQTSSRAAKEKEIGGNIANYAEALATALTEIGTCHWGFVLKQCIDLIRAGKWRGLLFIKQRLYDETPLRLRDRREGGQAAVCKVLQSYFRIGLLIQEIDTGRRHFYFGVVPTWLQPLPNKRAETTMSAQLLLEQSVPFLDDCCHEFDMALQLITTDRDPANAKAECAMLHHHLHCSSSNSSSSKLHLLHLPCDVHKASTCLTSMFKLVEPVVSGMLNFSLLLRPHGHVKLFRACVMEIIREKFRVIIGKPPGGEMLAYRKQVYKLFLSSTHSNADIARKSQAVRQEQVKILDFFLNGDLRHDRQIVWYSPFPVSREVGLQMVSKYVPYALLPSAIHLFPRHRWHGSEIPVDQLGLLQSHHNLLKDATLRFLGKVGKLKLSVPASKDNPGSKGATHWWPAISQCRRERRGRHFAWPTTACLCEQRLAFWPWWFAARIFLGRV